MKNEDVIRLAERLILLDESNQKLLAETFFTGLGEEELFKWFEWLGVFVYSRSRWIKIEQWMECRFEKNLDWTPRKMASVCVSYLKINSRMFPGLVKTAQRVKQRVIMRKRRHENTSDEAQLENQPGSEGSAKHSAFNEDDR